jgi:rare lipoprotein A
MMIQSAITTMISNSKKHSLLFIAFLSLLLPSINAAKATLTEGKASWIGERFQGKKTTSGEPFDMNDLTASHPTLPYGTKLKVTSKKTGKAVLVRVNNRSEIDNGRIIDLSKKAAEQIGLIEEGVGIVKVEPSGQAVAPVVSKAPTTSTPTPSSTPKPAVSSVSSGYAIQYASFFDLDNALEFRDQLNKKSVESTIQVANGSKTSYKVLSTKHYPTRADAKAVLATLAPQEGVIIPVPHASKPVAPVSNSTPVASVPSPATPKPAVPVTKASNVSTSKTYEYGIQFGAFSTQFRAKELQNQMLSTKKVKTIIHQFPDDDKKLYRVLTDKAFSSRVGADTFLQQNEIEGVILTFVK